MNNVLDLDEFEIIYESVDQNYVEFARGTVAKTFKIVLWKILKLYMKNVWLFIQRKKINHLCILKKNKIEKYRKYRQ